MLSPPADPAVGAGYPDSAEPPWTSRCQGRLLSICREERRAERWGGCRAGRLGQPGPAVAVSGADSRLGGAEALKRPSLAALADALELFCWDRCALGASQSALSSTHWVPLVAPTGPHRAWRLSELWSVGFDLLFLTSEGKYRHSVCPISVLIMSV